MTPPPTRPTLFPYTTLFRSLLTLEVLHRLDGALGKDAVTADGGVDRKDFDGGHAIGLCARERIDGGGHAFQPARGQREEAIVGILHILELDVETVALPRVLGVGDVDDRVAGPGRGRDVNRAVVLPVASSTRSPGRTAAYGQQQGGHDGKHQAR